MKIYFYLSLVPESLIASNLPPEDFGTYYATGAEKQSRGQAIFFEVSPFESNYFSFQDAESACVPHGDGQPKNSVYMGIYRVLEHIPLSSLKSLYLVTDDGKVLGIEQASFSETEPKHSYYLYQECCPTSSIVVSRLNSIDFCASMTNREHPISVSKLVFCDLMLDELANDADSQNIDDLPYERIPHLRNCLHQLEQNPQKMTKVFHRGIYPNVLYRTVNYGFFVGDHTNVLYYPLPSRHKLEREYYQWWRSALNTFRR
ncbi:MAG: hypothetical protein HQM13_23420 [SAR324 cluster bacterium]|nr:hypothetical protein [SAR324 cluster bacterium]